MQQIQAFFSPFVRLESDIFSSKDKISSSNRARYISMAALPLGLNLDFFLNGLTSNSWWSLRKCCISLSFLPQNSIPSFILALFICVGVGTNLSPFERREFSSLERCQLDKVIMLALTNFPSYLLLGIVALLSWIPVSPKKAHQNFR